MATLRGPRPRRFTLSVRILPERGGLVRATVNDKDGLEADGAWRHLLILVHGFNNAESEATAKYKHYVESVLSLEARPSQVLPDAVADFHWPGNEAVGPFAIADVAGYPVDVERALDTVAPLATYLRRLIAARPGARRISLVGHSLGCRVILETMRRIGPAAGPPFAVVNLMAAAAPVALAEAGQALATAPMAAATLLKAHSRADWVLWLAFPAGQFAAWTLGFEAAAYGEAIGRHGNPPGFGDAVRREGNGHGDYWTDAVAAGAMLTAMDATLRDLPAATEIGGRDLVPSGAAETRSLPSRSLPS